MTSDNAPILDNPCEEITDGIKGPDVRHTVETITAAVLTELYDDLDRHDEVLADLNETLVHRAKQLGEAEEKLARAEAALSDMTRDRDRRQWYVGENDRKRKIQRDRADQAEAALARVVAALPPCDRPTHGDRSEGVQMGWDLARQAALNAIGQIAPAATEATELRTALTEVLARLHPYHRVGGGPPLGYQILTPVSPADYNRWTAALGPASEDDPPAQCWHTEAGTPCDWDVCHQPERLAAGDYGIDPRKKN